MHRLRLAPLDGHTAQNLRASSDLVYNLLYHMAPLRLANATGLGEPGRPLRHGLPLPGPARFADAIRVLSE